MSRHLSFYNNDTLLQDNTEPGYFTEFTVPDNTNLIVCYDDDYKITCNIRVTASSNQDMIYYQYATDSALFLLKSLQNYTQNQTVRAQITVSNIVKDSNNLAQDIQNYLQSCGVSSGTSIDFSTIVTALNSITTALSALTNLSNLSNLADLANIITAITNKDNQSDLVNTLRNIFITTYDNVDYSYLKPDSNILSSISSDYRKRYTFSNTLAKILISLLPNNRNIDFLFGSNGSNSSFKSSNPSFVNSFPYFSSLNSVSQNLQNIETKLEQNLPFTTIVDNEIVETNVAQNCSYGSKIEQIPFSE